MPTSTKAMANHMISALESSVASEPALLTPRTHDRGKPAPPDTIDLLTSARGRRLDMAQYRSANAGGRHCDRSNALRGELFRALPGLREPSYGSVAAAGFFWNSTTDEQGLPPVARTRVPAIKVLTMRFSGLGDQNPWRRCMSSESPRLIMSSAHRLPSIIAGALVLPALMLGMAERSQTRSRSTPRTRIRNRARPSDRRVRPCGRSRSGDSWSSPSAGNAPSARRRSNRRDRGRRYARPAPWRASSGRRAGRSAGRRSSRACRRGPQGDAARRAAWRRDRRTEADEAARFRLHDDGGDRHAVSVGDDGPPYRDRDRRSARRTPGWSVRPRVRRVDEGAGLDAGRRDPAPCRTA